MIQIEEMQAVPAFSPTTMTPTLIPLAQMVPSPTNPRTRFDPAKQLELEASLRAQGFTLSVIVVRPIARGSYEIVAGERRYRAAQAIGMQEVPCFIRELDDQAVLELQLVENVQREDLTPLEEAAGLQRLLALRNEERKPIYTTSALGERIGKSAKHVEQRVKLCDLEGEARQAVDEGVLSPRTAILIAGLPEAKARAKFERMVLHPDTEEGPLTYRRAEALRREKFLIDLRGAPFDLADAALVPVAVNGSGERCFGGACLDCPFRTGNSVEAPEMPAAHHNLCLLPACYEAKKKKGWDRWQAAETDTACKRRAVSEEECRRFYKFGDQLLAESGMVDLADCPDSNVLRAGEGTTKPWKWLIGEAQLEVTVARDRNGRTHELVSRELAILAASNSGNAKLFKGYTSAPGTPRAATEQGAKMNREATAASEEMGRAAEAKKEAEAELKRKLTLATSEALFQRALTPKPGLWTWLMALLRKYRREADQLICESRGWKEDEFAKRFVQLSDAEQGALLVQWSYIAGELETMSTATLLKAYEVDRKEVEQRLQRKEPKESEENPELVRSADDLPHGLSLGHDKSGEFFMVSLGHSGRKKFRFGKKIARETALANAVAAREEWGKAEALKAERLKSEAQS